MPTIVSAFNNHFKAMCEDVLSIYPNDWNIKKAYHSVELLNKVKPSVIVSLWKQLTLRFKNEIESQGLNFFLEYEYKQDEAIRKQIILLEALLLFRKSVAQMSAENQEKVYEYIINLTKISHMFNK
jgi:hypothetical protein